MTEDEKKCIVEAIDKIDKRSKSDRLFAYILLIVVTFVVSVVGYNMSGLISSLSVNMQSISADIKSMRKEMVSMSHNIESMDSSMTIIASDIKLGTATHEDIAQNVEHLTNHIKNMQEDITDMNKMNPLRKIF
jgi:peptidoglycan hydrolase CwlO-like protein